MYQDFDHGLARERTAQMRKEVEQNRLYARSARAARSDGEGVARRGRVARGAAHVTALFRCVAIAPMGGVRKEEIMRRVALLLAGMAAVLVLASGVALAVNKVGTDGPDTLRGTDKDDNLVGKGGQDDLFGLDGSDNLLGGEGRDNLFGGNESGPGGGDKNLDGGEGNDVVLGGRGSDNIVGGDGNDLLIDGNLRDPSQDRLAGGDGNDVIDVINRPAVKDIVVCGDGFDRVLADRKDTVTPDCERVFVGLDSVEEFEESIPRSFFRGLPPFPFD